ncbi:substrate-binding domain-containing protein [Streptomyces hoynatensis]|uniref:Sugar ABC transporter substrate-binding protein n=1 Tax=Streptomyces hoynatensis TaxID=1141874 RepID=A0A3A9Z412_9ACTN|nr:substrate-binding domain-containing protein [Streptomyces hoynatensis]RKN43172.1 sugar ABC transporter substrate-binding protein [Streptomyces hoynatensis]
MATARRHAALAAALAGALLGCGGPAAGQDGSHGLTVGLLLSDTEVSRWEQFDGPLMKQRISELCADCRVISANANGNAAIQQQQFEAMVVNGVDVLILTAVDANAVRSSVRNAADSGIPVVAYDRLAEGPVAAYSSFQNDEVGGLLGRALLRALGDRAHDSLVVMMNGSETDPNAAVFRQGALDVLGGRVRIGKEYHVRGWVPSVAFTDMTGAIANLGAEDIDGVLAANDGIASGVIAALRADGVSPLPPVTGQDATLAALQRILAGQQYQTVYKPYRREAFAAAEMALALARDRPLGDLAPYRVDSESTRDIPAALAEPISVTAGNIGETVVRDGLYSVGEICTPRYESACARAGLTDAPQAGSRGDGSRVTRTRADAQAARDPQALRRRTGARRHRA